MRHPAINTHSANRKRRRININVSPPPKLNKMYNFTHDSAHSLDPCNVPAEREGDRVKGLRDMRNTDRQNYRQTDRLTGRDLRNL